MRIRSYKQLRIYGSEESQVIIYVERSYEEGAIDIEARKYGTEVNAMYKTYRKETTDVGEYVLYPSQIT